MADARTRVCFLSLAPEGGSARLRGGVFFPLLRDLGFDPELRRWPKGLFARRDLAELRGSVVVLQRILLPSWSVGPLRAASAVLLDVDDAVWCRPRTARSPKRLQRRLRRTLNFVDVVTCGSRYLCEQLAPRHGRVRVLPPALEVPAERPRVGSGVVWSGSATTLPYLEARLEALREGLEDEELVVVADREPRLPGLNVRFVPWSPDAELEAIRGASLGLYPLPRDLWTEGKCAFKVHLYKAWGLASLAVPWGGGAEALTGGGGVLFEDDAGLVAELKRLRDPALREELGSAGHADALATARLEDRAQQLAAALREALQAHP